MVEVEVEVVVAVVVVVVVEVVICTGPGLSFVVTVLGIKVVEFLPIVVDSVANT